MMDKTIRPYFNRPIEAADLWTLHKDGHVAACHLWTHPSGGEARVTVDSEWHRGEAGVMALVDVPFQWKAQFLQKGGVMVECSDAHRYWKTFESLPHDQGGSGRHRCAGCAYLKGFQDGLARAEVLDLNLDDLPESQAGSVRHRSPHAAFARGYYDGVHKSYEA